MSRSSLSSSRKCDSSLSFLSFFLTTWHLIILSDCAPTGHILSVYLAVY